jgi:hypothetical protein
VRLPTLPEQPQEAILLADFFQKQEDAGALHVKKLSRTETIVRMFQVEV